MRGRSITNDSAVLSLFQSINNMHPQLLELLNQLDERRRAWELGELRAPGAGGRQPGLPHCRGSALPWHSLTGERLLCSAGAAQALCPLFLRLSLPSPVYYEGLQDKLAQIRDARGALNALREEHQEKLRRAAEEAERQRQIQLAQKLEIMRQKKQVSQGRTSRVLQGSPGRAGMATMVAGVCGVAAPITQPCPHRSTWRCSVSWPSRGCRSRRRRGSCAWSSRSRPSR